MNLGQFHTDVNAALQRGNSQVANVPRWTRNAANWLEINIDFAYMQRFADLTLEPTADVPNALEWDNDRIKRVEFIQQYTQGADASRSYSLPMRREERRNITARPGNGIPTMFWIEGGFRFIFDAIPRARVYLEMSVYEYTDWPTDDAATVTLINRYSSLLFYQAVYEAAAEIKDSEAMVRWKALRDERLTAVIGAEDNAQYAGQRLVMGGYRGRRG